MNNVIIDIKSLSKYLVYLRTLFYLFIKYNISISPIKIFLGYLNINLLRRRVNSFGLITTENKLEVIRVLKYSTILRGLKHYLDLIGYLRNYIYYYAQLTQPL